MCFLHLFFRDWQLSYHPKAISQPYSDPVPRTSPVKHASVKSNENALKSALSCLPVRQLAGQCDEYINAQSPNVTATLFN